MKEGNQEDSREKPQPDADRERHAPRCDLCGAEMMDLHCKLTCLRCGYQRDCSDP